MSDKNMNNKNQSIQDKINEIKNRKKLSESENRMKKLKDLSIRSNNQSKLKITFSNDILTNEKLVLWIMSNELMKYSIINGNEEIVLDSDFYDNVLEKIDSELIDYMELLDSRMDNDKEYDLENLFLSVDLYEDMEIEECEVYKRNKIYDNVNLVVLGLVVFSKTNIDSNNEDLGDIKSNVFKLILESMIKLEKVRIGEVCVCEECEENYREVSIKLTGNENIDRVKKLGIDIDNLRMVKSEMGENREETIKNMINDIKKE